MKFTNIKNDFLIFKNHPELTYLDSTATSLKPTVVVNKIVEYYTKYSANIFRGVYKISEKATLEFEETRKIIAKFINAPSNREIIFTRNTTESINLLAYSLGRKIIEKKDEIVTSVMEHHSNFVPWQALSQEVGVSLKIIDVDDNGYLNIGNDLSKIITKKSKILALTYVSNVLGTINPIKKIIAEAKKINPEIITIIDAAQAVPHMKVDVLDLGCDFLVFSSHKMLGPTGVGVLWGKEKLLSEMYPFMYGGEMIEEVYLDRTTFKKTPHKFEAGTPAIAEIIALKESIRYINNLGIENIRDHEKRLTSYCFDKLINTFGKKIKIYGPTNIDDKGGIVAFSFSHYHAHDIASILDEENIAVRAGNHCAMPLHTRLQLQATVRASFYIYNDEREVDNLIAGLMKVEDILK